MNDSKQLSPEIQQSVNDPRPSLPHGEVMARMKARIARSGSAKGDHARKRSTKPPKAWCIGMVRPPMRDEELPRRSLLWQLEPCDLSFEGAQGQPPSARLSAWQRERNIPAELATTVASGCCAGGDIGRNISMDGAVTTQPMAEKRFGAYVIGNELRNSRPEVPRMRNTAMFLILLSAAALAAKHV